MNPLSIFQQALDATSTAILAGDFESYSTRIDLPYLILTQTGQMLVTEADQIRATFLAFSDGLKSRGVTHYERMVRSAEYVGRNRIEGWHNTHLIADGEQIAYPYAVRHTLVRRGDDWLFSEAQYDTIKGASWPISEADLFEHTDNSGAGTATK